MFQSAKRNRSQRNPTTDMESAPVPTKTNSVYLAKPNQENENKKKKEKYKRT